MLHPIVWFGFAVLIGYLLGAPPGGSYAIRIGKSLVGLAMLFVLIRFPIHVGMGIFFILYAFPATISIGSTNFIFIVLITVMWAVRVAMGNERGIQRTCLDLAILLYISVHILSLAAVSTNHDLTMSLKSLLHLSVPILMYYVIVNIGRVPGRLRFLAEMFTVGMLVVYFSGFMQRYASGVAWLPRWYVAGTGGQGMFGDSGAARVGGVFTHAMMADTAAFMAILQMYLAMYFKNRPWRRALHWITAAVSIYMISLTANRGGLIIFLIGLTYFYVVFAGELSWKRVVLGLTMVFIALAIGELAQGGEGKVTLAARTIGTKVHGLVPDTRRGVWAYIWDRIMEKPILGHGPYFDVDTYDNARRVFWPHNGYLYYFFTVGLVGLPAFLYLVVRVLSRTVVGWKMTIQEAPLSRGLTAVFHIGIVQFLIGQLRTDHQRGDPYVYFMWMLFAMGILARQVWEDEKAAEVAKQLPADTAAVRHAGA
ncbi:O-antigen ligase family protein [Candidatus Eisenbacteria bacterium]|uniref:O-antigen ligase family protein n=1 Tax=Eiseniibacteriota bacterium TaxID=2212470 RepID=A0ABV6YIL3_UNCEI